ncbi:CDP-alcohol phosphatidyltransferase family protein [Spirillospora albida]|uniref:CDP-alcohol phosphatidyltransferase family protein n=1 Tax=Spirillospora albida TaxID=58123 RepID=UPI00069136DC|nr:CDP-alcohol phosphatidyltransferase family protein [Spirillospora albida]
MARFSLDDVRATRKDKDAWWTVLLVDPVAVRVAWLLANWTRATPNQITVAAFGLGLGAAAAFWQGTSGWLMIGALLYHLGFVLDCVDGKIARLKGSGSLFGVWLDFMLDRVRDGICAVALANGLFAVTGQVRYLWLAFGVLALDMFRYVNGPQMAKVRRHMLAELGEPAPAEAVEEKPDEEAVDLQREFRSRFPLYIRVRDALLRHRIRTHLVSGIEFQMAVFIVAPLTGLILPVTAAAGAMLLTFELALIYKFCLSVRTFTRLRENQPPVPKPAEPTTTLLQTR